MLQSLIDMIVKNHEGVVIANISLMSSVLILVIFIAMELMDWQEDRSKTRHTGKHAICVFEDLEGDLEYKPELDLN